MFELTAIDVTGQPVATTNANSMEDVYARISEALEVNDYLKAAGAPSELHIERVDVLDLIQGETFSVAL